MVMRKRAVGRDTFSLLAGNTWDLRHVVGIKLLVLGSRSRAQKAIVTTITIYKTNFSLCHKKNVDFPHEIFSPLHISVYMINVAE